MSSSAPMSVSDSFPESPEATRSSGWSRRTLSLLGVALVCTLAGGGYAYSLRGIESTDDAQVDADVVAVPARLSGTVLSIHFVENQQVHAGDVLAELDAAPAEAKLAQAEANLAAAVANADAADADAEVTSTNAQGNHEIAAASLRTSSVGAAATGDQIREGEAALGSAEATLHQAQTDLTRAKTLYELGASTRSEFDRAQTSQQLAGTNLAAARARLASLELSQSQAQSRVGEASARLAQSNHVDVLIRHGKARAQAAHAQVALATAARDLAALDLAHTKILAPRDGIVSKKSINEGQTVSEGQTIVQLVPPERWVTANFKETQVADMQPAQSVELTVDAYPGLTFSGEVQSFSGATGSRFTLLPPDNATSNFTKVVQRIPVRIRVEKLPHEVALRPGMSVELSVHTRS